MGPVATTGVGFAFEPGRGATAVPVRSAFAGAVIGVVGVVAVVVFAGSLSHLTESPKLYGWAWDLVLLPTDEGSRERTGATTECGDPSVPIVSDRAFDAVASVCTGNLEIDGRPVQSWGIRQLRGTIQPTIVRGRAAAAPNEIALGKTTLDAIGKDVGDRVDVRAPAKSGEFVVVGQVLLPSPPSMEPQPLADAAALTVDGFRGLLPPDEDTDYHLLASIAPDVDVTSRPTSQDLAQFGFGAAVQRSVVDDGLVKFEHGFAIRPSVPVEIDRVEQISSLPAVLAAFLGFLALVAITHALVTTVRRRRRDLAILRSLGFNRGQVRRTVSWQATTVAFVALATGVPLGIALGRVIWDTVAQSLGVATEPAFSVLAVVALFGLTLVLVNIIALLAARRVAERAPARILATE
jgi:hypothetical protein